MAGFLFSTPSGSGDATRLLACCSALVEQHRHIELAFLQGLGHNLRRGPQRSKASAPFPTAPNLRFNSDVPSARRLTSTLGIMTDELANWTIKDWLESAAYAVAILGALAGASLYLWTSREKAIDESRSVLANQWTNEGDVSGKEREFITLELEDSDGDLIGSLSSPSMQRPLEVHAHVGWSSTTLKLSKLVGNRVVPVATVKIRVVGNKNRLEWRVVDSGTPEHIPASTILWPVPSAARG